MKSMCTIYWNIISEMRYRRGKHYFEMAWRSRHIVLRF